MTRTRDSKGRYTRNAATGIASEDLVASAMTNAKALGGGRITLDTPETFLGPFKIIVPPPDYETNWRLLDLDADALATLAPWQLVQYLADLSPAISRALWDFLRFANPGWEVKVYRPKTTTLFVAGQQALTDFINLLVAQYGSFDIVINRLFLGAFMRGAFFAELVLDASGTSPIDIATPDPQSVRFQRIADPLRQIVWQMGQYQFKGFLPLTRPTVKYLPIDPMPGSPYGRAPASPSLFPTLFLLGLMHDLRRVVQQQGYPRIDISIDTQKLIDTIPQNISNDPDAFKAWVDGIVSQVKVVYAQLQPDQAYVHTDVVSINRPVGVVDGHNLGGIEPLITMLESMAVQALKSMPLIMGTAAGRGSESVANREWEIHAAGIRSLQHLCETLIEGLFALALQAQGVGGDVQFRFSELRASEALRDEQTRQMKTANAMAGYLNGWISQDQAAQYVWGQQAVEEEPLVMPTAQSFGQKPDEATATMPTPKGAMPTGQTGDNTPNPSQEVVNAEPEGDNEEVPPETKKNPRSRKR